MNSKASVAHMTYVFINSADAAGRDRWRAPGTLLLPEVQSLDPVFYDQGSACRGGTRTPGTLLLPQVQSLDPVFYGQGSGFRV